MTEDKTYPIQPQSKGPQKAKMPVARAQRWLADGENGHRPAVEVFVTQAVYQRICAHAKSDMDNEVGGWLAGRWCRDAESGTEFVVVEALLPAQQVRSGSTFLTFTHDSQVAMLAALEERYAKKGVVGWYHTHPRMGVFLSGYDVWLHDHFFPQPWQVALVVEPHSGVGGFFIRDKQKKLDPRKYFGFYELRNRRVESVMKWKNLRTEELPETKQEEKAEQNPVEAAPSYQVTVEPKVESKKQVHKLAKLERKEFKEIIGPQNPAGGETPPLRVEQNRGRAEVSSPNVVLPKSISVKKPEPVHFEVKASSSSTTETKKIEIKTETNGNKNSEEAKS